MKWEVGRQGTGYFKKLLLQSKLFKFDVYLLKYPKGSHIPPHTDKVPNEFKHFRLNIILNKSFKGGDFILRYPFMSVRHKGGRKRFIYFRPDIVEHELEEITEGIRYVLSIGWLERKKDEGLIRTLMYEMWHTEAHNKRKRNEAKG